MLRYVKSRGPEDSPFVIVGEAPGAQEVKLGEVFVGPSGIVLNHALDVFKKGSYPEPYITNIIPHFIKDKDMNVLTKLVQENTERLRAEIAKHPRKIILALGNAAIWALTGNYGLKITQNRGKLFHSDLAQYGVVAATHPAYLLRGNGSLRQFKSDVAYAIDLSRGGKPHEFIPPTWEYVDNPDKAKRFVEMCRDYTDLIAGDLETKGFSHQRDSILMAGYTLDGNHVYVVPGTKREYLPVQNQLDAVADMWESQAKFSWHNGKFDIRFLQYQHQQAARVDHDTMLMSYSLDETRGIHDLETVSGDYLGSPNWKGILDAHKKKNQSYDVIPEPVLTQYMCYDIANTFNLTGLLKSIIDQDDKSSIQYNETLIPSSAYLAKIEMRGMLVDQVRVEENRVALQAKVDAHKDVINQIAIDVGFGPVNPNSPVQLSNLLYNTMKIPTKDRGTGKDVLEKLPQVPIIKELLAYRKVIKGLSTYVTPLIDHLGLDGAVHPSYLIHGTATGRLACRDPNLQNIPRDPALRGQFIPRPGYCYMEVDLNQAELRSLAALSGDPELCRIYADPKSKGLHEEVRAQIYGYPTDWSAAQLQGYMNKWYTDSLDRVLEEQKMRAKNVNFGIVYGITSAGLSEQIEDTTQEAQRMLIAWARKFPVAWGFIEKCRSASLRGQNLTTVFGYRKRFQIVTPETLTAIQNESANFPHQSTASTITVHGGMRMQDRLAEEFDAHFVNTVHDSIIIELPMTYHAITSVSKLMIAEMEQVPKDWGITRVPFKADAKVGMRWGYMTSMEKFLAEHNLVPT